MTMTLYNETLNALNDGYQTLLAQPLSQMTLIQQQQHASAIHKLNLEITKLHTVSIAKVNALFDTHAAPLRLASEQLAAAANDDSYTELIQSINHSLYILDTVLLLAS